MQFRLSTLLWFFVVIGCALGTFGLLGLPILVLLFMSLLLHRSSQGRVSWIVAIGLVGFLASLAIHIDRFDRSACCNGLKQIGIALHNYHDAYGQFPPAYVADAQGRPMHSWRVLLLPYLDDGQQLAIARQYRFDEPWDGPNNRRLARQIPPYVFRCSETARVEAGPPETTNYVAVTGPGTAWPGDKGTQFGDFRDGTPNTILIVEITGSNINWMEPRDITLDEALAGSRGKCRVPSSHHGVRRTYFWDRSYPLAGNVLFADGSATCFDTQPPRKDMSALLSIAGGESVDTDAAFRSENHGRLDWGRCIGYPLFFFSLIVLVSRSPTETAPADTVAHDRPDEKTADESAPATG